MAILDWYLETRKEITIPLYVKLSREAKKTFEDDLDFKMQERAVKELNKVYNGKSNKVKPIVGSDGLFRIELGKKYKRILFRYTKDEDGNKIIHVKGIENRGEAYGKKNMRRFLISNRFSFLEMLCMMKERFTKEQVREEMNRIMEEIHNLPEDEEPIEEYYEDDDFDEERDIPDYVLDDTKDEKFYTLEEVIEDIAKRNLCGIDRVSEDEREVIMKDGTRRSIKEYRDILGEDYDYNFED